MMSLSPILKGRQFKFEGSAFSSKRKCFAIQMSADTPLKNECCLRVDTTFSRHHEFVETPYGLSNVQLSIFEALSILKLNESFRNYFQSVVQTELFCAV